MRALRTPRLLAVLISVLVGLSLFGGPPRYDPSPVTDADKARATEYLSRHLASLPDWTWAKIDIDGGTVRYGLSGNAGAPVTILYVPGYLGTVEFYAPFLNDWYARGYRVAAMDLPGQGGSSRRTDHPEKPWTGDFRRYGDAVAAVASALRKDTGAPLILVGDSFGGHSALRALTDHPQAADGVVAMAPALELYTPGFPPLIAKVMTQSATIVGLGARFAPGQSTWALSWDVDPETFGCGTRADRVHLNEAFFTLYPEYRVAGVTHEWLAGLERSGAMISEKAALAVPALLIVAEQDMVVDNARANAMCDRQSPLCTLHRLPTAQHCMLLEQDVVIADAMDATDRFIAELLR